MKSWEYILAQGWSVNIWQKLLEFDQINFNLHSFGSNSIITPKIQELNSNNKSEILQDNNLDQTDSTVDKISVKNEVKIDSSKNQTNDNDFVASDETFFGYSIFENNPFKPLPEYSMLEFFTETEKDISLFS